jgi:hypothetical protein
VNGVERLPEVHRPVGKRISLRRAQNQVSRVNAMLLLKRFLLGVGAHP